MADAEDSARQLAQALSELTSTIRGTTEEEKKLAAIKAEEEKAAAKFAARMDAATKTVGAVADAFVTYNKEIYKGTSAAKADAAAMEKLANAAEFAAAGLALLIPGGPVIKAVVAGLGLLAGQLLKLNAEVKVQTGEIYKAFQDLSKAGATGSAGMQGVFDSLMKVGMGTEKFAEYIKLVSDNAQDLALMGGTVKRGSDLFADSMGKLTDQQRIQMEVLVGDRQAQAEATMGYLKQQRMLTAGTKQQMDTSSAAVMRYIKETDELTRITGLNRAEQEKQNEQAMRNEVFLATVNEIRMKHGDAAAQQLLNFNASLAATPKAQKAFQDGISGFIGNSEEAAGQFMQTGGVVQEIGQRFREGLVVNTQQTAEELKKFGTAVGKNATEMSHLAKVNNYGATYSADYAEAIRLSQMGQQISAEKVAEAQKDQTGAIEAGAKMAKAENDARQAQLAQQKFLQRGMDEAIDSIAFKAGADRVAAEAALAAAAALNQLAMKADPKRKLSGSQVQGYAQSGRMTQDEARAALEGGSERDIKALGGRQLLESIAAGQKPSARGTGAGPSSEKGQITGKTEGVNGELIAALENAAAEFGSPIKINSGVRTVEEQQQMYKEWLEGGGGPGTPTVNTPSFGRVTRPARPGSSNHQDGNAVDIDIAVANQLDRLGLLAKNGLVRPVAGDPVHIQLAQMETGGFLEAGKLAIAGENGKPEIIQGPANVTSNNDIMAAFANMTSLLERSLTVQENMARYSSNMQDNTSMLLQYAQN